MQQKEIKILLDISLQPKDFYFLRKISQNKRKPLSQIVKEALLFYLEKEKENFKGDFLFQ